MVVLLVNHISTEIMYVYSIYMITMDKSHTCLFLSDTFREKSLIRSRLMDLFLFSDKTCLIPITDALPSLSTDSVNTTSLFVDESRQATHLFINVTFSHQSMYHVTSVFSSSSSCFVWEFWNQKTPIIFFYLKIYLYFFGYSILRFAEISPTPFRLVDTK